MPLQTADKAGGYGALKPMGHEQLTRTAAVSVYNTVCLYNTMFTTLTAAVCV